MTLPAPWDTNQSEADCQRFIIARAKRLLKKPEIFYQPDMDYGKAKAYSAALDFMPDAEGKN